MWKAIWAALRALGRVVTRTIKLASGAVITILELLSPPATPVDWADEDVDDAAARVDAVRGRDGELEGLKVAGDVIRRAASEMLEHGRVLDPTVPTGIKNWLSCLGRTDLAVLIASTPEDVARHVLGQVTLATEHGVPVSMPHAKRDAARLERRRLERKSREKSYAASMRKRKAPEPSIAVAMAPAPRF